MCRRWIARGLRLLVLGLGLGVGFGLAPRLYQRVVGSRELEAVQHHHAGPTLDQLLPLASLVTLRVQVSDVVETRVHGVTGGITALVLVKGDVELATDLALARFEQVDEAGRTAVLVLPEPKVGAARLDHGRTRIFALARDGLWHLVPGDFPDKGVVNKSYVEAERAVTAAAEEEVVRARARTHAEGVLDTFFAALNWRVKIRWRGTSDV